MTPTGKRSRRGSPRRSERAAEGRATVVCLLPARTDTAWWRRYVMATSELRFIRHRLRCVGIMTSSPFPSVVVVFLRYGVPTCSAWRAMQGKPLSGVRKQQKGGESMPAMSHVPDTPPHE